MRMSPALPHTSFNSSKLVRALSELGHSSLAPSDSTVADAKQTLAERMSPWLAWTDAIALSAVLESGSTAMPSDAKAGKPAPATSATAVAAAVQELARVRADLARSITADPVFAADSASFVPYRHQYVTHQRAMEARIAPLRAKVRALLSSHSPNLRRLAALDAVLEQALSARERQLLSTVPQWLERHFERARQVRQQPDGKEMQDVLLAELETRLQPVEGLTAALGNEAGP